MPSQAWSPWVGLELAVTMSKVCTRVPCGQLLEKPSVGWAFGLSPCPTLGDWIWFLASAQDGSIPMENLGGRGGGSRPWAQHPHGALVEFWVPGWPGLDPAVVGIWGVSQQVEELCLSAPQMNQ